MERKEVRGQQVQVVCFLSFFPSSGRKGKSLLRATKSWIWLLQKTLESEFVVPADTSVRAVPLKNESSL